MESSGQLFLDEGDWIPTKAFVSHSSSDLRMLISCLRQVPHYLAFHFCLFYIYIYVCVCVNQNMLVSLIFSSSRRIFRVDSFHP